MLALRFQMILFFSTYTVYIIYLQGVLGFFFDYSELIRAGHKATRLRAQRG